MDDMPRSLCPRCGFESILYGPGMVAYCANGPDGEPAVPVVMLPLPAKGSRR